MFYKNTHIRPIHPQIAAIARLLIIHTTLLTRSAYCHFKAKNELDGKPTPFWKNNAAKLQIGWVRRAGAKWVQLWLLSAQYTVNSLRRSLSHAEKPFAGFQVVFLKG